MSEEKIEKSDFIEKYKKIGAVFCPYFRLEIGFNGKGLNHVFFQGSRSERDFEDMQTRMRLMDRAVKLLKIVTTHSGYICDNKGSKPIHYWEFIAVIDNRRIKVVVRQQGDGGAKHFWSVIPKWKTINGRILNSSGRMTF